MLYKDYVESTKRFMHRLGKTMRVLSTFYVIYLKNRVPSRWLAFENLQTKPTQSQPTQFHLTQDLKKSIQDHALLVALASIVLDTIRLI